MRRTSKSAASASIRTTLSTAAATEGMRADSGADIELRQSKYLNNIVAQDRRAIETITGPMLTYKSLRCAPPVTAGAETMHTIKDGQLNWHKDKVPSAASQFHSFAC